jgi:hypothetical protein
MWFFIFIIIIIIIIIVVVLVVMFVDAHTYYFFLSMKIHFMKLIFIWLNFFMCAHIRFYEVNEIFPLSFLNTTMIIFKMHLIIIKLPLNET